MAISIEITGYEVVKKLKRNETKRLSCTTNRIIRLKFIGHIRKGVSKWII